MNALIVIKTERKLMLKGSEWRYKDKEKENKRNGKVLIEEAKNKEKDN